MSPIGFDDAVMDAATYAARVHAGQVRKDGSTPYVAHVYRVALRVGGFGCDQPEALAAALLHDTIEDCDTDYDDLHALFGQTVADWVALLSKDARKPEPQREKEYYSTLATAPWQVRLIKLADCCDNLADALRGPTSGKTKPIVHAHHALNTLGPFDTPPPLAAAADTLRKLIAAVPKS